MSQELDNVIINNPHVNQVKSSDDTNMLEKNSVGVMSIVFFCHCRCCSINRSSCIIPCDNRKWERYWNCRGICSYSVYTSAILGRLYCNEPVYY